MTTCKAVALWTTLYGLFKVGRNIVVYIDIVGIVILNTEKYVYKCVEVFDQEWIVVLTIMLESNI